MKTARHIAAEALLKIEQGGAWSNLALDHAVERSGLPPRDGAMVTALVYGVLERRLALDACIAAHSKTRLDKLSPAVRAILRLSLYQLVYLDRIPDHSAVNEGVELTRRLGQAKASGFVNGVLRSFLRAGKAVPLPEEPWQRLSVEHSVPMPLVDLWRRGYGDEKAAAIIRATAGPAPVFLRANTLRTTAEALRERLAAEGVTAEPVDFPGGCLRVLGQGALHKTGAYEEGLFHIQDRSSQACALSLGAEPGMAVLDACAAPGGKAFTLAQRMENRGRLVATDLHSHRVGLIEKQAERLGISILTALEQDMTVPAELGQFDRVLCDVPCSGLGVVRRKPEIRYKPVEEFAGLPELQYKILATASHYCKAGGQVLYSTCTLNPAENSAVALRFREEHPAFAPAPLPPALGGDWERTLAGEWDGDGFYMALFERK